MRFSRMALLFVAALPVFGAQRTMASGPITSGSTVSGSVASPTYSETWTFSGSLGQRVLVTAVTTGGALNTTITIQAPGGAVETTTSSDRLDWQLAASGTYSIVISDYGLSHTGTYALGFLNVSVGPYSSGPDPDGGYMLSAESRSGTTSGPADMDAYQFNGSYGDRVLIDAIATAGGVNYNTTIYLYPPGGGALVAASYSGDRLDARLSATGVWTIVIEDYSDTYPGSYNLSFLNVTSGPLSSASDPDGGAITSNGIKTGQFQVVSDFDAYTFTGTAGDRVVLIAVATGGGFQNTEISLYPPGGGPAETATSADRVDWQLAVSGTYTVVIEDYGDTHTGGYTTSYFNVTRGPYTSVPDPDGGPILSNAIKSGTMSGAGDVDGYQFSGTIGARVLLSAVATAGAGFNTTIYLYPPDGGPVLVASYSADRLEARLTATGTWTVLVEDYVDAVAGSYNLGFLNATAGPYTGGSETDGGVAVPGTSYAGSANASADFDGWVFTGAVGDTATIVARMTSGSIDTYVSLYPPGGGAALIATTADSVRVPLAAAGTYTIVIEDYGQDQTGTYSLKLTGPVARTDVAASSGPLVTMMLPATPSPFMDTTRLDFRVATEGHVVLRIFDVNGRVVRTLVNDNLAPGLHPVNWDGRDDTGRHVASGTYYAQFVAGRVVKNQKVVCLR